MNHLILLTLLSFSGTAKVLGQFDDINSNIVSDEVKPEPLGDIDLPSITDYTIGTTGMPTTSLPSSDLELEGRTGIHKSAGGVHGGSSLVDVLGGGLDKHVVGGHSFGSVKGGSDKPVHGASSIGVIHGGSDKHIHGGGLFDAVKGGPDKHVVGGSSIGIIHGGSDKNIHGGGLFDAVKGGSEKHVHGGSDKNVHGGSFGIINHGLNEHIHGGHKKVVNTKPHTHLIDHQNKFYPPTVKPFGHLRTLRPHFKPNFSTYRPYKPFYTSRKPYIPIKIYKTPKPFYTIKTTPKIYTTIPTTTTTTTTTTPKPTTTSTCRPKPHVYRKKFLITYNGGHKGIKGHGHQASAYAHVSSGSHGVRSHHHVRKTPMHHRPAHHNVRVDLRIPAFIERLMAVKSMFLEKLLQPMHHMNVNVRGYGGHFNGDCRYC